MKRFLLAFGSVLLLLVGVVLVRALRYRSAEAPLQWAPEVPIPPGAAERLAGAVRIPTISFVCAYLSLALLLGLALNALLGW
jgi:hypothetical protein